MRLWGWRPGPTRWPVLTISTRSPSFRYAFCAVPCKLSGGGQHQSWHHSTVLPRLGSNRMESYQNLHTHAGDSAIQLQGNNRVLKKRVHPQYRTRNRDSTEDNDCTLSQLRLGHCHLLQDYKHRVFGESSDLCTDCRASPQDVRHLFACTTHPTDLSPEDLWRNPVRSISTFCYLNNGNLDWLEDGPGRGKQQQPNSAWV